jgi:hypothetical protein
MQLPRIAPHTKSWTLPASLHARARAFPSRVKPNRTNHVPNRSNRLSTTIAMRASAPVRTRLRSHSSLRCCSFSWNTALRVERMRLSRRALRTHLLVDSFTPLRVCDRHGARYCRNALLPHPVPPHVNSLEYPERTFQAGRQCGRRTGRSAATSITSSVFLSPARSE